MRHILPLSLTLSALAFVAAGTGMFIWWLGGLSQPSILSATPPAPTPAVEFINSAIDIEALRRYCLPVAEFQEGMFQATRTIANQTEKAFSTLIVILVTVGTILGVVFGFIYLTMRRLRAKHPTIFE